MRRVTNAQKLTRYLEVFISTDEFLREIKKIRSFYKIPENGYEIDQKPKKKFWSLYLFPKKFLNNNGKEYGNNITGHFLGDIIKIFEKYNRDKPFNINRNPWLLLLMKEKILYGNNLEENLEIEIFEDIKNSLQEENLAKVSKSLDYWVTLNNVAQEGKLRDRLNITESLLPEIWRYPIFLKINPAITKNDLLEYINKNWSNIKTEIDHIKANHDWAMLRELGDTRKKIIKASNKNKTTEEVRIELNKDKNDKTIGYEDIHKAKFRDRKRRQKVVST